MSTDANFIIDYLVLPYAFELKCHTTFWIGRGLNEMEESLEVWLVDLMWRW